MKRQFSILMHLLILLALCACGLTKTSPSPMPGSSATTNSSRLPDPNEVKTLLVQLVDVEKRAPGIVVGMIADDPQERWVVVLMNVDDGPKEYLGYHLLRGLPKPFPVDPQVLAAYAGNYQLSDGIVATIRADGTRMFLQVPSQPEYELFAASENRFYYPGFDLEITFYRNGHGEADRIVGVVLGETYEAKKVP